MRTEHLRVDAERTIARKLVSDLLAAGYFIRAEEVAKSFEAQMESSS